MAAAVPSEDIDDDDDDDEDDDKPLPGRVGSTATRSFSVSSTWFAGG